MDEHGKSDYAAVTHKTVKGRIDGITNLYRNHETFFSAPRIKAVYCTKEKLLTLSPVEEIE